MKLRLALFLLLLLWSKPVLASGDSVVVREPRSLGPLTVWLVEGSDETQHSYLTLEQALDIHEAIVHNANSQELWIENKSDTDLFIQSSDLLKGGQQDRMVMNDMIVPAGMVDHPDTSRELNVYCIEHGRSTKRGNEPIETFSASDWMAPLSHTRLVAMHELTEQLLTPHVGGLTAPDTNQLNLLNSLASLPKPFGYVDAAQESIWNDVSNVQTALTQTLNDSVTRNVSPTSLELTLENNSLANRERGFQKHLEDLVSDNGRAIGFVYAIAGRIMGAERYGSHALFKAMWPKLLRSIAAEAIIGDSLRMKEIGYALPSMGEVQQFMTYSGNGKSAREHVNERTLVEARKSDAAYFFQTFDTQYAATGIHSAWIAR